jgi:hypothetical protein
MATGAVLITSSSGHELSIAATRLPLYQASSAMDEEDSTTRGA